MARNINSEIHFSCLTPQKAQTHWPVKHDKVYLQPLMGKLVMELKGGRGHPVVKRARLDGLPKIRQAI